LKFCFAALFLIFQDSGGKLQGHNELGRTYRLRNTITVFPKVNIKESLEGESNFFFRRINNFKGSWEEEIIVQGTLAG
jgi:hypothetical protein